MSSLNLWRKLLKQIGGMNGRPLEENQRELMSALEQQKLVEEYARRGEQLQRTYELPGAVRKQPENPFESVEVTETGPNWDTEEYTLKPKKGGVQDRVLAELFPARSLRENLGLNKNETWLDQRLPRGIPDRQILQNLDTVGLSGGGEGSAVYKLLYGDAADRDMINYATSLTDINIARRSSNMLNSFLEKGRDKHIAFYAPQARNLINSPQFAQLPLEAKIGLLADLERLAVNDTALLTGNAFEGPKSVPMLGAPRSAYANTAKKLHPPTGFGGERQEHPVGASTLLRSAITDWLEGNPAAKHAPEDLVQGAFYRRGGAVSPLGSAAGRGAPRSPNPLSAARG